MFFQPFDLEHAWWRLLHKHVMCTKFDIYDFIKEIQNLTCNLPPVNFANAIYQCYLNQIICLCTINIGIALFNSVFSNTILLYSNVCYIYNERPSSSQNVHWLYIYIYEFFIILYNIIEIAELDCCQIIILSIYVPSTHAYTHVLRLSLDLPYEKR